MLSILSIPLYCLDRYHPRKIPKVHKKLDLKDANKMQTLFPNMSSIKFKTLLSNDQKLSPFLYNLHPQGVSHVDTILYTLITEENLAPFTDAF